MDPSLLKERDAFRKKAMATPVLKMVSGSSQYRFGVLAKIVKHMRKRHQEGNLYPLTLEEILDETNQLDAGSKVKQWLQTEALPSNPKIMVTPEGKYQFKPPYDLRDRKTMLKLLRKHDLKGYGGLLLEDVQESLPNCDRIMKQIANDITYIVRPQDKKKVIFYNDRTARFHVDEELAKLWRSVPVRGVDDEKIEEYLERQGLQAMHDHGLKKLVPPKRKSRGGKRKNKAPKDNDHLKDVLETYDEG
ncbi:General transcription factor IIE subunit 2 [Amphibalanus amphitrite]|uniref:General transcription factor IIE subunit 2 n=1 Tax=Amphibalanus amphitrite TaxID=1232801 RepID=A0A6A4V8K1_AMPAM|nr:General transcription factor IIE subunit 2 [Amphibalanus amphitrite]